MERLLRLSINKLVVAIVTTIAITLLIFLSLPVKVMELNRLWLTISSNLTVLQLEDVEELERCQSPSRGPGNVCPSYFSWIEHDLATWKQTGISQQDVLEARPKADFRVVIVNGSLYMERFNKCFETRDDYTLWGLLMLLQEFPGMVPDVDMMFNCGDFPMVVRQDYEPNSTAKRWPPPPLFVYCITRSENYDIVIPDWSFWGWPEVNIGPWPVQKGKISEGAKQREWSQREPIAFWKGNYWMGPARGDLTKCTANDDRRYNLVTQNQDWGVERQHNFHTSDLSKQCSHRYKVYVEGRAWSVSLKYIMACGSTVLQIEPAFQEFFARSLIPFVHFWPINRTDICNSIKFAVEWGNANPDKAAAIGKCAQSFLEKELTLDFVYQYMLHLLQEYSKMMRFKPVPPPGLQPMTLESNLPGHELTIPPKNKTRAASSICSISHTTAEAHLARQIEGYSRRIM